MHMCTVNCHVLRLYLHADGVSPTAFTLHSGDVRALNWFSSGLPGLLTAPREVTGDENEWLPEMKG